MFFTLFLAPDCHVCDSDHTCTLSCWLCVTPCTCTSPTYSLPAQQPLHHTRLMSRVLPTHYEAPPIQPLRHLPLGQLSMCRATHELSRVGRGQSMYRKARLPLGYAQVTLCPKYSPVYICFELFYACFV